VSFSLTNPQSLGDNGNFYTGGAGDAAKLNMRMGLERLRTEVRCEGTYAICASACAGRRGASRARGGDTTGRQAAGDERS
jgi:hypothetical protein